MTVRAQILSDIKTTVSSVDAIRQIEAGKWSEVELKDLSLPAAFVIFGADEVASGPMGFESFWLSAVLEVWCKESDMEDLLGAVHAAMLTDITRGGNAVNTVRDVCTPFALDPSRGLAGFDVTFKILYRHPVGSP
ncbi:MAG: hypothetical protein M1377_06125 [Deltaproteobacteria bacterium]|nr:hypothetical protein [Deltaproteobacteria bacterium]